jgi:hypothetical protein
MKKRFPVAATLLLTVVVSTAAYAAPQSSRNPETRFDTPHEFSERIVRIIKTIGKKLVPVSLQDNIATPKP